MEPKSLTSEKAFEVMKVQGPQKPTLKRLRETEDFSLELICSFPDFYAVRVSLRKGCFYKCDANAFYQVLFIVAGNAQLETKNKTLSVQAGQCIFLPAQNSFNLIAPEQTIFLICTPEKF